MKSSHLQSLIARNSREIHSTLQCIHMMSTSLVPRPMFGPSVDADAEHKEYNRPIYAALSGLQRERKKLEALQKALKDELKGQQRVERGLSLVAEAGLCDVLLVDFASVATYTHVK